KDYDRLASGPRNRAGLELSAALAADPDVDLSRFDAGSDEEQVELSLARRPAGARLGRALRREHAAGEGAAGRYRAVDARGPALSGLRSRSLLPGAAAARAWPRGRRSLAEARRPALARGGRPERRHTRSGAADARPRRHPCLLRVAAAQSGKRVHARHRLGDLPRE